MTVTEFLDEANVDLAAMQQVLDTARPAVDMADRTQRFGVRVRRFVRRMAVAVALGLVGAATVYAFRAVLAGRRATAPAVSPTGPDHNGSVAPGADGTDPAP